MSLKVIKECPLTRREYEQGWAIPENAIRVSIGSDRSYEQSIDDFRRVLTTLSEISRVTVFETFDLYTRIHKWPIAAERKLVKVGDQSDLAAIVKANGGLSNIILSSNNEAYTATACGGDEIDAILKKIRAMELIFTFSDAEIEVPLSFSDFSSSSDRVEQVYFESLSKVRCVLFLSYDHVDMEVITVDPEIASSIENDASF